MNNYGRAWQRIRKKYIRENPLCECCLDKGVVTFAEEVHHKVQLAKGGTHSRENLMSLCKSCHAEIHKK